MDKIRIEQVTMTYQDKTSSFTALENVNLSIRQGEFVCIVGSSGCGKSTLLGIIEGLNHPEKGKVYIDDREITGPGIDRGVVFQHYSLFPWLTATGNITFAMKQAKVDLSKKEMEQKAREYLQKVGLADAADKYPAQLSGGMQQRVAIARALAMNAETLLMDEPFGAIDPKTRQELQALVSRLASEEKRTVVFVTHDIDEAILLADRIIFMGEKQILDDIPVKIPKPRTKATLFDDSEYHRISNHLLRLFYRDIAENIGGEEVVI